MSIDLNNGHPEFYKQPKSLIDWRGKRQRTLNRLAKKQWLSLRFVRRDYYNILEWGKETDFSIRMTNGGTYRIDRHIKSSRAQSFKCVSTTETSACASWLHKYLVKTA